ncbi:CCA tRNA nucleotidyltransferase [Halobacillus naozhouensis]|uniref:CCA-adding enzyme n=1 Tax=Halobacillus naozhouensis TaxID=554880 RepID=A0ABY8IU07_9BACI|nr:CCA tRNA nucleotidyltransferase [Halobacillus naozhouensis]WFT73081.1 CCA tRNA nucleotidyltransferase [Halobacillus naozhouensis]
MYNDPLFQTSFSLLTQLHRKGFEGHIVGGAVRDLVLGRPVGDIDIATSATPDQVNQVFDQVIPIGVEHGTVLVRYQSQSFEVTTYRTEQGYTDFRHPDQVSFVQSIQDDLSRRDFTINAMAMDANEKIIDPYGGKDDLANGRIRAVGDAQTRFSEDPLRMMRALRFASQLQFEVESEVRTAIEDQAAKLGHIATERVAIEFAKLTAGVNYKEGLQLCSQLGVFSHLPIFSKYHHLQKVVPADRLEGFAVLITYYYEQDNNIDILQWVKSWKQSNKVKRDSFSLAQALREFRKKDEVTHWLVYQLPEHLLISFVQLLRALGYRIEEQCLTNVAAKLPIQSRNDLAFGAKDLIQLFPQKPKGPWIKSGVEKIEYAVVNKQLPNKYEQIKEWVDQWNPPVNN